MHISVEDKFVFTSKKTTTVYGFFAVENWKVGIFLSFAPLFFMCEFLKLKNEFWPGFYRNKG